MIDHPKAHELDVVELTEDLPAYGLTCGARGTVVEVFTGPEEAYMIEFQNGSNGGSKIVDWVLPNQLENLDEKANCLFEAGWQSLCENKLSESMETFRRSVQLKPSLVRVLHNLFVERYVDNKAWESLAVGMWLLIQIDPTYDLAKENFAKALLNQGVELANEKQFDPALKLFLRSFAMPASAETVKALRQNISSTHISLGVAAYRAGDLSKSLRNMQEAYKFTSNKLTRRNLGIAYLALGDKALRDREYDAARASYRAAEETGMRSTEGLNNRAIAHLHLGEFDEAIQALETSLMLNSDNRTARQNLSLLIRNARTFRKEVLQQVRMEQVTLEFSAAPKVGPADVPIFAAA